MKVAVVMESRGRRLNYDAGVGAGAGAGRS